MPEDGPTPPADRRSRGWWFLLLLAAASLMWSGQGTAVKILEVQWPDHPLWITFLPFYVATCLLLPLLMRLHARDRRVAWPGRADWGRFAVAGIAGQVLAQLGMTWGVLESLASNGAVMNLMIPVFSAVLASLVLGERLTPLRTLCLAIGLVGVALMSVKDIEESDFLDRSLFRGNALILVGCFGSSFYNVYCKGLMARFHEVEILIYSYITASLASLPVLLWLEPNAWSAFAQLDGAVGRRSPFWPSSCTRCRCCCFSTCSSTSR